MVLSSKFLKPRVVSRVITNSTHYGYRSFCRSVYQLPNSHVPSLRTAQLPVSRRSLISLPFQRVKFYVLHRVQILLTISLLATHTLTLSVCVHPYVHSNLHSKFQFQSSKFQSSNFKVPAPGLSCIYQHLCVYTCVSLSDKDTAFCLYACGSPVKIQSPRPVACAPIPYAPSKSKIHVSIPVS
jgi:hypothetical protein